MDAESCFENRGTQALRLRGVVGVRLSVWSKMLTKLKRRLDFIRYALLSIASELIEWKIKRRLRDTVLFVESGNKWLIETTINLTDEGTLAFTSSTGEEMFLVDFEGDLRRRYLFFFTRYNDLGCTVIEKPKI